MERARFANVSAWSSAATPLGRLGAWRDDPGSLPTGQMPRRFLRHADEHSVVACRAVLTAIATRPPTAPDHSPDGPSNTAGRHPLASEAWGVLAASCGAGRIMGAASLAAMKRSGAAGVSTHVVPQCSLHAAASSLSVLLGLHGPHFGIGGGPEAFGEALVVAVATLDLVPPDGGLWLVLTGWEREPRFDDSAAPLPGEDGAILHAFAMALTRQTAGARVEVEVNGGPPPCCGSPAVGAGSSPGPAREAPGAIATPADIGRAVEAAAGGAPHSLSVTGGMTAVLRPAGERRG
jgi:hypothetical protein